MNILPAIEQKEKDVLEIQRNIDWLKTHEQFLTNLPETVEPNAYGTYSFWLTVKTREDLQACLALTDIWQKEPESTCISYNATIDGQRVCIKAEDTALPPTCKIVTEKVVMPAQPAYMREVTRVVCNQNSEVTT